MKTTLGRIAAATVAVLAVSACRPPAWFNPGVPVDVVEIGRAQLCGAQDGDPGVQQFDTSDAVLAWRNRTDARLRLPDPLEPGRYAVIGMGRHSTGGFGIAVSRDARIVGERLSIYATFFAPAPGAVTVQMLTAPCVLVRLPESGFRAIDVYDQDGKRRISSSTESNQ